MNSKEIKDTKIFVNMFVHYPETYNANTISNKFDNHFIDHKCIYVINNIKSFVMINSVPHSEEESINFEICLTKESEESINKENVISDLKSFVLNNFNNQIKIIEVEFTR